MVRLGSDARGVAQEQSRRRHRRLRRRTPGACGVANAGNQVSEMSVQYNKSLKKYVTLYGDQFNNIVMRTSDTPQGDVVVGEGADGPAERRHLRADDASVVAVDHGHRYRPVLEPVAVVASTT